MSEIERIPPQDLEAEQALLGALLLGGPEAREAAGTVRQADFYRESHGRIFAAAMGLAAAGEPVDLVTVTARLREREGGLEAVGGVEYLDRMVRATPYSANAARYAEVVRDRARARALLFCAQGIAKAVYEGGAAEDLIAAAYQQMAALAVDNVGRQTMFSGAGEIVPEWEARGGLGLARPVPTGLPGLDAALGGGWRRPQVHILTAQPGVGKSSLVTGFLLASAAAGRRAGLLSLEMPLEEVMARIVSAQSNGAVSYKTLERGLGAVAESDRGMGMAAREWAKLSADQLVIDDATGYSPEVCVRKLWQMREKGADLLVVDLASRIRVPGAKGIYEASREINGAIQAVATETGLGCPVILVVQLKRDVKRVSLDAIKGAGDWAEDSPVVLGLERDERKVGPGGAAVGRLRGLKVRGGQQFVLPLWGDPRTLSWAEAEAGSEWHEDGDDAFAE